MKREEEQSGRAATMVLHNLELLERILQYLSGCKKTLISASLTAKAFSEPAFNVLWYEIPSIWPLFCTLPTFKRGRDQKYVFTGPIRNDHIHRALYYAKRIRFLNHEGTSGDPYANTPLDFVISTVTRMDKLGAFLPLRKIHIHEPFCNTMLLPLTSPNLDNIEIRSKKVQTELTELRIASFLESVTQSPLRSLAIEGPFKDTVLQVLPDFNNLDRLAVCHQAFNVPVHYLKRFALSMPSLRHLHVDIAPPSSAPPRLGLPHSISFPSLETLHVGCDTYHLENLLGILDAPILKSGSLRLIQKSFGVTATMHEFVQRNRQLVEDKVHKLHIETVDPSFSFVKSFGKLKELSFVSFRRAISMSDIVDTFNDDGSWSRTLVDLQLMLVNPTTPLDGMSIAALSFIADACPNLESLEISIHSSEKPEKPMVKKDWEERELHGLKRLVFLNLPVAWEDTMPLAIELVSLLDHLFPSMAVPNYTGGARDMRGSLARRLAWWKGVQDMWGICQTIKDRNVKQRL